MPGSLRIVLVGQTPPPYGGQAVMTENTLKGRYRDVEISFVRVAFSRELRDIGRPSASKAFHLVGVVLRIVAARIRSHATVLYYSPAGPDRIAMYRDLVLLLTTRWMFEKTVFHFHAGGVSELYPDLPSWLQPLFRRAFFHADVAIRTSPRAPEDPRRLMAALEVVIPNGVDDTASQTPAAAFAGRDLGTPVVLFVGLLSESKGLFVLLEACAELKARKIPFRVQLVGELHSPDVEARMQLFMHTHGLDGDVEHRGVLTGADKDQAFAGASVVAFPTFFEHETFGLVLVEAMQFGLPVVATSWRGIPAVVDDGTNGFLVPVRDSAALAERLALLLQDRDLARRFGRAGRQRYEERYTLNHYQCRLQEVFDTVRQQSAA